MYTFLLGLFGGAALLSLIFWRSFSKMKVVIVGGSAMIALIAVSITSAVGLHSLDTEVIEEFDANINVVDVLDSVHYFKLVEIKSDTANVFIKKRIIDVKNIPDSILNTFETQNFKHKSLCFFKEHKRDTIVSNEKDTVILLTNWLYLRDMDGEKSDSHVSNREDGGISNIILDFSNDTISQPYAAVEYTQYVGNNWITTWSIPAIKEYFVFHLDTSYKSQAIKFNFQIRE